MATLEERVGLMEGRVGEHSRTLDAFKAAVVHLQERMDQRFEQIDQRFEQIGRRFEQIDRRLLALEQRFDQRFAGLDQRLNALDDKIDRGTGALDAKISRQFLWLAGVQVTTLAAIVAAFATMMAAFVGR